MSIKTHNTDQAPIMDAIRDEIIWHLGVELGRNPRQSHHDMVTVELRFAEWICTGGSEWLRNQPGVRAV